jgi:hypothetical protein
LNADQTCESRQLGGYDGYHVVEGENPHELACPIHHRGASHAGHRQTLDDSRNVVVFVDLGEIRAHDVAYREAVEVGTAH